MRHVLPVLQMPKRLCLTLKNPKSAVHSLMSVEINIQQDLSLQVLHAPMISPPFPDSIALLASAPGLTSHMCGGIERRISAPVTGDDGHARVG
jgi:hypothetical protein